MAKRSDDTERRIYVLPIELLARVRAYQGSNNIPSEVEAVRRLLDMALQMRDTFDDIMVKLKDRFSESSDLRAIARDVLWSHPSVSAVQFSDADVSFTFKDGDRGKITSSGQLEIQPSNENYDTWHSYLTAEQRAAKSKNRSPTAGWDSGPARGGADDEIPF